MTIDPTSRLTAEEALKHPWLCPPETDASTPKPDLLPTFRHHVDPRMKLKRSLLAVKATGDFKHEGQVRKTRREMWGEEERKIVEKVEAIRKEAEEEAVRSCYFSRVSESRKLTISHLRRSQEDLQFVKMREEE